MYWVWILKYFDHNHHGKNKFDVEMCIWFSKIGIVNGMNTTGSIYLRVLGKYPYGFDSPITSYFGPGMKIRILFYWNSLLQSVGNNLMIRSHHPCTGLWFFYCLVFFLWFYLLSVFVLGSEYLKYFHFEHH